MVHKFESDVDVGDDIHIDADGDYIQIGTTTYVKVDTRSVDFFSGDVDESQRGTIETSITGTDDSTKRSVMEIYAPVLTSDILSRIQGQPKIVMWGEIESSSGGSSWPQIFFTHQGSTATTGTITTEKYNLLMENGTKTPFYARVDGNNPILKLDVNVTGTPEPLWIRNGGTNVLSISTTGLIEVGAADTVVPEVINDHSIQSGQKDVTSSPIVMSKNITIPTHWNTYEVIIQAQSGVLTTTSGTGGLWSMDISFDGSNLHWLTQGRRLEVPADSNWYHMTSIGRTTGESSTGTVDWAMQITPTATGTDYKVDNRIMIATAYRTT